MNEASEQISSFVSERLNLHHNSGGWNKNYGKGT